MKKKWLSLAVAAVLTNNVYAAEVQTVNTLPEPTAINAVQSLETLPALSAVDMQAAFQQDAKPMQVAALSGQEMKETEGAWVNWAVGGLVGAAGYGYGVYAGNYSWNTYNFLGNIATGALIGGTFGAAGAGLSLGANIWRFNSFTLNTGVNTIWRR